MTLMFTTGATAICPTLPSRRIGRRDQHPSPCPGILWARTCLPGLLGPPAYTEVYPQHTMTRQVTLPQLDAAACAKKSR